MTSRRRFIAATAGLCAAGLAGCTERRSNDETDSADEPVYDVSLGECDSEGSCTFSFSLNELAGADHLLIESREGTKRLTEDEPEVSVETDSFVIVYSVEGDLRTFLGQHEVDTETTDSEPQPNPQAGVTFDEDQGNVTVQVVSIEEADYLRVLDGSGEEVGRLEEVGDSLTVSDVESGSTIMVVGGLDDNEAVIATYQVD